MGVEHFASNVFVNKVLYCTCLYVCLSVCISLSVSPLAYLNKSSAVAEMVDRLATVGMGRKWGGAAVGAGSPTGHPSNTV